MRFSEREGFAPVRTAFQIDSVDGALRNSLWNVLNEFVIKTILLEHNYPHSRVHTFLYYLWFDHYQLPIDRKPEDAPICCTYIRERIFKGEWYEICDFIEFALNNFEFSASRKGDDFRKSCNYWLEREMSAWRIVANRVTRLTSEEEIEAVEQAHALADEYAPVATHIATALARLSDRRSPDYRNSIKEAISAVESVCRIITNNPKATLGEALKHLAKNGVNLHPALKLAFDKLYGYTSDEGGIRHSLLEQPNVDFEDAKFMLVSCSAFVNLLRARR